MPQKIRDPNWMTHLWERVLSMFGGLNTRVTNIETASYIPASQKGAAGGVAELDSSGHVPSSQLPSYVDDVLEYSTRSAFPATGEAGKIYIALDTNVTYRWGGSAYVEITSSLALGETSSTAYRGDRGKIAYDHAQAKGSAFASGLYKVATNAEGHVTGATAVVKQDITDLGIPGAIPAETDPTVPAWAKAATKPAYTASEVGALPDPVKLAYADLTKADNDIPAGTAADFKAIFVQDKNGRLVGYIIVQALNDGKTSIGVYAGNYVNGGSLAGGIRIIMDKAGSWSYQIANPAGFRSAIVAQQDVGLYIDAQGYICQRIGSDT